MPIDCQRSTSGGKGNDGMFFDRTPYICAAGIPSQQPDLHIKDLMKHYLLQEEAEALISDTIFPTPAPRPLPPLRKPIPIDKRNGGPFSDMATIINPPDKTKFLTLVDDIKETNYKSYWQDQVGQREDYIPKVPKGLDMLQTFGKVIPASGRLYDIVMPKVPHPDKTPREKQVAVQIDRKYCKPAFNPNVTFGYQSHIDKRGRYVRCCLTDDRVMLGNGGRVMINTKQRDFKDETQPPLGRPLIPNNNIKEVPEGYAFGKLKKLDNLPECLSVYEINPGKDFFKKCISHLNTIRKMNSKRFLPTFYRTFYLNLKYYDQDKTDWLPKEVVYKYCASKLIRFDSTLIEPLLRVWNAFDGSRIKYEIFVQALNHKQRYPDLPKVEDVPHDCLDFRTTYRDMTKIEQIEDNSRMAGVPSGRYLDLDYPITPSMYCRADRMCLPQESDMKSCLNPSIFTLFNVSHRDMYKKREPDVLRKLFEAAGESFPDKRFQAIWEKASKLHSQGWVCFETFRRCIDSVPIIVDKVRNPAEE